MPGYRSRFLDSLIPDLLAELAALILVGPRATGKTTTAARHCRTIVRLGQKAQAAAFHADPDSALAGLEEPVLLDEWQAVPHVLGAVERAATTLLSGPAAGPLGAAAYTRPHGGRDCVVVDMGGTSFDASLVRGGEAEVNHAGDIDRLRIALPMLAITTIGAGGGSIGWTDEGGLLRMGPASAGASPGPACYGRGGEQPTCTDANLLLGYLDPGFFAGGEIALRADLAREAIRAHVAEPLGLDVEAAAAGMYRVINANMAHGVREVTVKRGLDPRAFPLVVAGGAGALHACMIAAELEMPELIVPPTASVLCAAGMLLCDLQHDDARSLVGVLADLDLDELRRLVAELAARGDEQLRAEGVEEGQIEHHVALDLRYRAQYHEVTVAVDAQAIEEGDLDRIAAAFHAEHDRLYGYQLAEQGTGIELINVRVRALGRTDKPALPAWPRGGTSAAPARKGTRRAYCPESARFAEIPVYDGAALRAGHRLDGPALIERADTTLLVTESFRAEVDALGSCLLAR